jgi:cell pole-organizing protein PopZ
MLSQNEKPEAQATGSEAGTEAEADVLDLTEAMVARQSVAVTFRTIDAESDVVFNDAAADAPPARPSAEEEPQRPKNRPAVEEPLLSSATNEAVETAFHALARTVLVDNARTLEDLVKEMLRPMLKSWLDDNLPNLVERLVRAEIERVSRGRG